MTDGKIPGDLTEVLDDDPKGAFIALDMVFGELDGVEELLEVVALVAREENLNLFREMKAHPEAAREVFPLDPDEISDDLVEQMDSFRQK